MMFSGDAGSQLFDESLSFWSGTSRCGHNKRGECPSLCLFDTLLVIAFLSAFVESVQSSGFFISVARCCWVEYCHVYVGSLKFSP